MSGSIEKKNNHGIEKKKLKKHVAVRNAQTDIEEAFIECDRGGRTTEGISLLIAKIRRSAQVLFDKIEE